MADTIKEIVSDSLSSLNKELSLSEDKLVIVDFFATWCGPCVAFAPKLVQLQKNYSQALFLKVDIDKCPNIASRYEVRSVPTFIIFKGGEVQHRIKGADEKGLEAVILQHVAPSGAVSTSPSEQGLHIPGQNVLNSFIEKSRSECLNDSDDHPFSSCLSPDSAVLVSDCDEQLILFVSFNQSVRLHSILLKAGKDRMAEAPKTVVLFLNQVSTPSFDDVERMKAVQEFSLNEDQLTGDHALSLHFVKFQNVQSVTLFIKDNQSSGEETALEYLAFYGTPLDVTNMKDFKRVHGEKGESH